MIYICEKWVSRHCKYRVYFELQLIDGKKCEARGLTAIGLPFSIPIYMGRRPGPMVPDCGAYAIRPYPAGRLFSSEWVGRNSIRPIRRPRQGNECGFWVVSMGHLFGSSGPCPSSAMGWGLAPTGPHLLFLFMNKKRRQKKVKATVTQAERRAADAEIRKTCVATLRFGHSDFRARPCNSSFRALGDRCRSSGRTMVDGWSDR